MYAIYANIYHQYTPVMLALIYQHHGSYGIWEPFHKRTHPITSPSIGGKRENPKTRRFFLLSIQKGYSEVYWHLLDRIFMGLFQQLDLNINFNGDFHIYIHYYIRIYYWDIPEGIPKLWLLLMAHPNCRKKAPCDQSPLPFWSCWRCRRRVADAAWIMGIALW